MTLFNKIHFSLTILMVVLLIWTLFELNRQDETCDYVRESHNITDKHFNLHGYYSTEGYYCVLTNQRWFNTINDTDVHESCHALIDKDYEHFCRG